MTLLGRSYFGVYVSVAFMNQTLKFLVKLGRIHLSQLLQVGKRNNFITQVNATLKLKRFFSIKIPVGDKLKSDDYKLARFPFGLTGSTIATIASAYAISEERNNLQ